MRKRTISLADIPVATQRRLWDHIPVAPVQYTKKCWEWQGATFRKGYGNFHVPGLGNIGAHIVVWLVTHPAESLEPTDCVLHACDNPPCCRPSHVFKGTKKDNTQDAIRKGRFVSNLHLARGKELKGEDSPKAKLTNSDVITIRLARKLGYPQKPLAKRFGVRYQSIQAIEKRKSWKHLK